MPANTNPIYGLVPHNEWGTVATANTAKDGTGTQVTIFTADGTNGGFVEELRFRPLGTNVASVARIFMNNGSTNATAANNILIEEVTLPATTLSEVAALVGIVLPINRALKAGYKLNVAIGTTVSAGWAVSAHGAQY